MTEATIIVKADGRTWKVWVATELSALLDLELRG